MDRVHVWKLPTCGLQKCLLLGSRVEPCSNRRTLGKPQSRGKFAMEIPVQNTTKLEVVQALYGTNSGGDDT